MKSVADLRSAAAATAVSGRSLALVVGPLGGGVEVAHWLLAATGGHETTGQTSSGVWSWPGGRVRDLTSDSAPAPTAEPGAVVDLLSAPPRVPRAYDRVIDLRTDPDLARAWFAEVFPGSDLAAAYAPAGRLVSEASRLGLTAPDDPHISDLSTYLAYESHLLRHGGARFLDFARVVALVHPRGVYVGDEWVQLANQVGGHSWSVADLSILLLECQEAFVISSVDGIDKARFASPFLLRIVSSRVPTSASEHYALFRALRDMAVRSLLRSDPGDQFVAKELPLQALWGNAVEELCDDGMALLAADPQALVDVVENPESPVSQGAKLVLRAGHRLGRVDTLSQLELAARRSGLARLADQMAEGSPARQWHPIWATSQPVHTNRVIFAATANVLCLAPVTNDPRPICFAGLSNGHVWQVSATEPERLIWQDEAASEVRCIASLTLNGESTAFTGHSNQTVRAITAKDGATRWSNVSTMTGPLSAIATGPGTDDEAIVVAGGVDGRLVTFNAETGAVALPIAELGAEVRGIGIIAGDVIACLVDGTVASISLHDGQSKWRVSVPGDGQVCNAMTAAQTQSGGMVIVGTAAGSLYELEFNDSDADPKVSEIAQLGSSINAIRLDSDDRDTVIYAALSDASWVKRRLSGREWTPYLGHVGTVNALLVADDGRVFTGGGDGTVRSWIPRFMDSESITLEWGVRHRGPVTGISIDISTQIDDITQVTGGHDGSIRAWSGPTDTTGTLIAEHDSPVKALIWDPGSVTVYVGHADGVLRTVTRRDGTWVPRLIGIQHDGIRSLALSPAGRLFSAGVDGTVTRWHTDLLAGAVTKRVTEFGHVSAISWLNQSLAVGAQDGTLSLLEPRGLNPILSTDLGTSVVSVTGHGRAVFAGLASGEVVALPDFGLGVDAAQGQRIHLHNGEIRGIEAFELSGNLVIATTGLDRRLVITDLRTHSVLADIALDGFGLGLHADSPYVAVSTTSGAMILELSAELPGFLALPRPLRG